MTFNCLISLSIAFASVNNWRISDSGMAATDGSSLFAGLFPPEGVEDEAEESVDAAEEGSEVPEGAVAIEAASCATAVPFDAPFGARPLGLLPPFLTGQAACWCCVDPQVQHLPAFSFFAKL